VFFLRLFPVLFPHIAFYSIDMWANLILITKFLNNIVTYRQSKFDKFEIMSDHQQYRGYSKHIYVILYYIILYEVDWLPKVMRRSERRNNLQIGPRRDSNTGGSDLQSSTLPIDDRGAPYYIISLMQRHCIPITRK